MKISYLAPFSAQRPAQLLGWAALAQWTGRRLWQGTGGATDPLSSLAFAAGAGFPVSAGLGVALMRNQHPYDLAVRAVSTVTATGHELVLGVGTGARSIQAAVGASPEDPLGVSRDYLTILSSLLHTGSVAYDGKHFTAHMALPTMPRPAIHVGLGVLRPGMAQLAGELGARAITWLTPASYLADVIVPAIDDGVAGGSHDRQEIVAIAPMARRGPDRDPRKLVLASNAGHLRLPHYRDMLKRSGIHVTGEPDENAADRLLEGGAFLYGDDDELRAMVAAYEAAGVDELVINPAGVYLTEGPQAALAELEKLSEVVQP